MNTTVIVFCSKWLFSLCMNLLVEHDMPAICWLIIVISYLKMILLKIGNKNNFIMCVTRKQDKSKVAVANTRKS